MPVHFGSNSIIDAKYGDLDGVAIYRGTEKLWPIDVWVGALVAESVLSGNVALARAVSGGIVSVSDIVADPSRLRGVTGDLIANSVLSATATRAKSTSGSMVSDSAMQGAATLLTQKLAEGTIEAVSALSAVASMSREVSAALNAVSDLSAVPSRLREVSAGLASVSAFLDVPALRSRGVIGDFASASVLSADATVDAALDVKLLLHLDGADESTTTTDSSTYSRAIDMWPAYSLRIDQDEKKFGSASWRFSGIALASTAYSKTDFDWWTDDYTIEMWIRPTSSASTYIVGNMTNNSTTNYWALSHNNGVLSFYYWNGSGNTISSGSGVIALNTWSHIAMVHSGGTVNLYANGSRVASQAYVGTPQSSSSIPLMFGRNYTIQYAGYIDEVRIVKGTAVYTGASYTTPTSAHPDP